MGTNGNSYMLKTASALLAAVAFVCGGGVLALGPDTRAGLVLLAGTLFFGWLAFAAGSIRRELNQTISAMVREPRSY